MSRTRGADSQGLNSRGSSAIILSIDVVTEFVHEDFLTLSVRFDDLEEREVQAKYTPEIADRLIKTKNLIGSRISENSDRFAIRIQHNHYITKQRGEASSIAYVVNKPGNPDATSVQIVKQLHDPNETHKYPMKRVLELVRQRLNKEGISCKVNQYPFNLFVKAYDIKEQEKYCYVHRQYDNPTYTYSTSTVDLLVDIVRKDPDGGVDHSKKAIKNKKN